MSSVCRLKARFQRGELERDQYWAEMRAEHERLLDYSQLLATGTLRGIEIDARGLQVVFRDGLRMRWRPSDTRSVPSVALNNGGYEQQELELLERLAGRCKLALDIGANAGFVALRLARVMGPGSRVYAFEPVSDTFAELTENIRLNQLEDRIDPLPFGFSNVAGRAEFYVPEFHGSVAASQRPLWSDAPNRRVQVELDTLDAFIVRQNGIGSVDLIKCDVEGAELMVLQGGQALLSRDKPLLLLEMLRKWAKVYGYHPNDILEFLGSIGYRAACLQDGRVHDVTRIDDGTVATNFFLWHPARHEHPGCVWP